MRVTLVPAVGVAAGRNIGPKRAHGSGKVPPCAMDSISDAYRTEVEEILLEGHMEADAGTQGCCCVDQHLGMA